MLCRVMNVVLAYTDPPGMPGATEVLVNDLDLNVTDGFSIATINLVSASQKDYLN